MNVYIIFYNPESYEMLNFIPLDERHAFNVCKWSNDPDLKKMMMRVADNVTLENRIAWIKNLKNDTSKIVFAMHDKETDFHIGNVALASINYSNHHAESSILIGDVSLRKKGFGSCANKFILNYAFNMLHMNKVYVHIREDNYPSIKLYKKFSFSVDGVLKEHFCEDNRYIDVLIMSLLKRDWDAKGAL